MANPSTQSIANVSQYLPQFQAASMQYGVPVNILESIADHESAGIASAVSPPNNNGTVDYGLMQINSANFAGLGLNSQTVLDPTTNINAGASILATAYNQTGNWSQALSIYNTGSPNSSIGANYASIVLANANGAYATPGGITGATGVSGTLSPASTPVGSSTAGYGYDPSTGAYDIPLTAAQVQSSGGTASGASQSTATPASGGLPAWLQSYLPSGSGIVIVVMGVCLVVLGIASGVLGQHPVNVVSGSLRKAGKAALS